MATLATNEGVESVIDRSIDWIADTFKAMLCTTQYVENRDDQFIDIGGANDAVDARVPGSTDQTLTGKAIGKDTVGDFAFFKAGNVTFTAVPAGATVAKVVVYKDTGVTTTSKILAVFDVTDTATNGGDVTIAWATDQNGGLIKFSTV
jgi:hypothetical protein